MITVGEAFGRGMCPKSGTLMNGITTLVKETLLWEAEAGELKHRMGNLVTY